MSSTKLPSYADVTKHLKLQERQVHLLLGNGFSVSYDPGIFSYKALSKFVYDLNDKDLKQLFDILNTNNFELLMQQLDNAAKIAILFGAGKKVVDKIKDTSDKLKTSLIDAIKELHPEHVFKIPEAKSIACAKFLNSFLDRGGYVYTTNYDLLLYWVLMRNGLDKTGDGFGRESEDADEWIPEEEREYSDLRWGKNKGTQAIYYLHGALQIFDTGIDIIKEEYTGEHWLLENIKKRMDSNQYPIFVTAGSGKDKLTHIMHNKYLAYCYEALSSITGSLICYGFGFGEYDDHIIAAINKASKFSNVRQGKLYSIYIGIYSEDDYKHIRKISKKFNCKVNMFDAKTVNVWG
jgi:hypothetical protein